MPLEVRFLITCSSSVPHDQPHKPSCVYSLQYIAAWEPRVQLIAKKRLTFPKNKTASPVQGSWAWASEMQKSKTIQKNPQNLKSKRGNENPTKKNQTWKTIQDSQKQSLSMIITLVLTVICKNLSPPDFCAFREMFSLHEVLGKEIDLILTPGESFELGAGGTVGRCSADVTNCPSLQKQINKVSFIYSRF